MGVSGLKIYYKICECLYSSFFYLMIMEKEVDILKIMKKEKCSWEEASKRQEERKDLNKFF